MTADDTVLDHAGSSAIVSAVDWAESILLGTMATAVAIISVAAIGFLMLTGRIDVRRASTVILGCFLIFGARAIVDGLRASMRDEGSIQAQVTIDEPIAPPPLQLPTHPSQINDPYAGAAVPRQNNGNPWAS